MRRLVLLAGALGLLLLNSCARPPDTIPSVVVFDGDAPNYFDHLWIVFGQRGDVFLFEPDPKLYSGRESQTEPNRFVVVEKADFEGKKFAGPVHVFKDGKRTIFESASGWQASYASSPTTKDKKARSTVYLRPSPETKH